MITMIRNTKKHYSIGAHIYSAGAADPALYLVATPIGNLSDITLRALELIAGADILACEDTRVSRILLERYKICQKPISYHDHNSKCTRKMLIAALLNRKSVVLISDAGTPLIADPGFKLVKKAHEIGIRVIPVPGPSAALAALIATGLPANSFFFCGFLSPKKNVRRKYLESLQTMDTTLIFYESPHRVIATLADMMTIFGSTRPAAFCRELTKIYETVFKADLGTLYKFYHKEQPRGEIVLVLGLPDRDTNVFDANKVDYLLLELSKSMSLSRASGEVARITGMKRQNLYARLLILKNDPIYRTDSSCNIVEDERETCARL